MTTTRMQKTTGTSTGAYRKELIQQSKYEHTSASVQYNECGNYATNLTSCHVQYLLGTLRAMQTDIIVSEHHHRHVLKQRAFMYERTVLTYLMNSDTVICMCLQDADIKTRTSLTVLDKN